ncbi:MAG: ubiquinol-cytochrome c reductase iron-sulfur subunit [Betaproteobacteria bacterium]|nr:ubiquinol-cytochrome c reductase iron-sulfur subunit [Betaproteobacteria bacterium]
MNDKEVDRGKRRFLIAATSAVGGVATVGVAIPFIASMLPSERAKAAGAPVKFDISKVEPGMLVTVQWRGKPVWVIHRTPQMLATLQLHNNRLRDPNSNEPQQPPYCKNPTRSIKPEYMIAVGICTHLGCVPTYRPDINGAGLPHPWEGGFLCPCHGSLYDLACRVFKDVPAPLNLVVPPHKYLTDTMIKIGEDA